jgi:hypothetical protein
MAALRVLTVALVLVGAGVHNRASAQSKDVAKVMSCGDLTLAKPQQGVAYTGLIENSDYRFTVRVPSPHIGWGAASGAPFHGFAVFLGNDPSTTLQSCITFLIEHRVLLPEDEGRGGASRSAAKWRPRRIGNRDGFQEITRGSLNGVAVENITARLELPRDGYTNDLTIWFVTPVSERSKTEPIFQSFMSSFKFW